jgi:hypothetical protein
MRATASWPCVSPMLCACLHPSSAWCHSSSSLGLLCVWQKGTDFREVSHILEGKTDVDISLYKYLFVTIILSSHVLYSCDLPITRVFCSSRSRDS